MSTPQWALEKIQKAKELKQTRLDFIYWQSKNGGKLTEFPIEILELPNLRILNFEGNALNSLPESINALQNLIQLDLSNNKFKEFPEAVSKLKGLKSLLLAENQISDIPPSIAGMQNLEELSLSYNNFAVFPVALTNLVNLKKLGISGNQIKFLPETISNLSNLSHLSMNSNVLNNLPETIGSLRNLRYFYVSNNLISELPEIVTELTGLISLDLFENPLVIPPLEVGLKGVNAIREYFRQLGEGQDFLYEAKLLILGEGGAGKTTLAQKILNRNYQLKEEKSTQGVDVVKWSFDMTEDRTFQVNIWDFGGQEIYHSTHQFFLTKRSLYCLVADTRKEDTDFYYWMNSVDLLADNSPLLIIKNEKQDRHRDLNERQLRGQFSNLKEIMSSNFFTNRGLDKVEEAIKHYVKNLPHIGSPLPKTWVKVRAELEKNISNYISLDNYLKICKSNGFNQEKDSLQLSDYLHDIGVFLHFQDDPLLRKVVILKPKWGTDAVYKVLDNKIVIKNLGRFTRDDLDKIWISSEYDGMRDELLQLMMKFKLCYEIPGQQNVYIAPQLLTENQPYYIWDENDNLFLRYEYDFMPKGILMQFVVAINRFILTENTHSLVWRSGVVMAKDQTKAEIIEYYSKHKIHIRVSGAHRKELMSVVMYEIDKIHSTYKKLRFDKLIPCNCLECRAKKEPYFYRFDILQKFIEDRQFQIQCQQSYKMVNVRGLVDDVIEWKSEKEVDEIMKNTEKTLPGNINVGDNFSGIIITGTTRNSFNKIESSTTSDEIKETLKQLVQSVEKMKQSLPEAKAIEVSDDLEKLVDEALKENPSPKWYSISIDGLIKAAEKLDKLGKPVINLSRKILSLLSGGLTK